jgi:sarcosine oxidase subunit gamma
MADLTRVHPLQSWTAAFEQLPAAVRIGVEPYLAMVDLRLGAPNDEVTAAVGVALPSAPNTWRPAGAGKVIWLGPDEWLITSTAETPEALEARIRPAAVAAGGAAADVSAQRTAVRLTGPRARQLLAKGCAVDLHPRSFGLGDCAQTTLGRAGIVLLGLSDAGDDFLILVRSSFAGYLADWLLDAATEYAAASVA